MRKARQRRSPTIKSSIVVSVVQHQTIRINSANLKKSVVDAFITFFNVSSYLSLVTIIIIFIYIKAYRYWNESNDSCCWSWNQINAIYCR